IREFGPADGIAGAEGIRRHRSVVADAAGRVWFSLHGGVSVIDPARLFKESVPAIVHVQSVSADGSPVNMASPPRVPAGSHRVTFGFVGLSLSAPDRVKFRYRLDGFDHDWIEPAGTLEAVYTNLSPRSYHFRVIASNSEGHWNSEATAITVEVLPLFWQTSWFQISAVLGFALVCIAVYRLRLHQVTNQLSLRFEERIAERIRIAQDLHDTLLQSLVGASMELYVATNGVPAELPARHQLNDVLEKVRRLVDEGRNAVSGLRSSGSHGLENALASIRQQQSVPASTKFRVMVEGRPRAMNGLVRDEVYRIGREAVVNSFRHSRASSVEVTIEYASASFRLLVRDDGRGIDPAVLSF